MTCMTCLYMDGNIDFQNGSLYIPAFLGLITIKRLFHTHDNNIWWHFGASGRFHNENFMSKNIYHTKNYIHHWFYDTLQKLSFVVLI